MKSKTEPIGHSLWGIRAGLSGEKGDGHNLFIERGLIALKKQDMGDLRLLPKRREAFYAAYESTHRGADDVAIRGIGGKFYRFIHEIQLGDNVLYPCRFNGLIYIGEVVGRYFYDDSINASLPHRRKVRWNGAFPKQTVSKFGRREIGAARTLFRINTNVEEFVRLIAKLSNDSAAGELVPQDLNDQPASVLLERIKRKNAARTDDRSKIMESQRRSRLAKASR